MKINLGNIFIIRKSGIAFNLMFLGMLIAFFGSLSIWFMWSLATVYCVVACIPLVLSWLISRTLNDSLYEANTRQWGTLIFLVYLIYQLITNGDGFNAFIAACFHSFIVFTLLSLKEEYRNRLARSLSICIGCILAISIPAYMLYILGYPLPNYAMGDSIYTFSNYYFFLVDTNAVELFPRFRSIFLEPGHVGTVCALLLFTQIGKWHRWYNILMIAALIMSFSLAAYILFILIIFVGLWMQRKHVFVKLALIVSVISSVGIGAYFYNDGNNLLNELILARLEINDEGKLTGDNRVSGSFEDEFDQFMESDDILFGRDYTVEKYGFGNSGYRVFLFNYGFVGLVLSVLFYISMAIDSRSKRSLLGMWLLAVAIFYERATQMYYYNIIPLFIVAYWHASELTSMTTKEETLANGTDETDIC
ncbi:MAG: hypothetical protein I3J02_10445 [Prevotella sp.]|nr:hypothetical protein [Prevotella sp.]